MDDLSVDVPDLEHWVDQKVEWRSRRGLLELDLILMPFFEKNYRKLNIEAQKQHQWLLSQKDTALQSWLAYRKDTELLSASQLDSINRVWQFVDQKTP